jgi:hypothetical protein
VFLQVHAYKNLLKAFVGLQRDLVEHQNRGDSEDMSRVSEQIQSLYREIEKEQQPIIDALSRQIPSMGETNQDLSLSFNHKEASDERREQSLTAGGGGGSLS